MFNALIVMMCPAVSGLIPSAILYCLCGILCVHMDDIERKLVRLTRQTNELLAIAKQNNRILRGDRFLRMLKICLITVVLFAGSGYMYYLFQEYQVRILDFWVKVDDLHDHMGRMIELGSELGDTAQSVRDIFSDSGE